MRRQKNRIRNFTFIYLVSFLGNILLLGCGVEGGGSSSLTNVPIEETCTSTFVDIRAQAPFADALSKTSFTTTMDGLEITLEAQPQEQGATLWWDSVGGFGVQFSYEQDEIEGPEILKLRFLQAVSLSKIFITKLYNENGYLERGAYEINENGSAVAFTASEDQVRDSTNGELALVVEVDDVNSISFTAPGTINEENHEFAVQGVCVDQHKTAS